MKLSELFKDVIYSCNNFRDDEITDIVYDSRKAAPDTVFVALTGAFTDGHDYAQSAYLLGARVFLLEREIPLSGDAVQIIVENSRAALAIISAEFFGHPDREINFIGVTGTKGKTTITHLIASCLNECGIPCGTIGTVGAFYPGPDGNEKSLPTVNTTPESYETHKILRTMINDGVKACCIEVSSLGLKHHRVDGMHFSTAVFTNFSPDHIGGAEHNTIEEYAYWKKQLFRICDRALLNADDDFSKEIITEISCPYATFGLSPNADFSADNIRQLRDNNFFGVEFTMHHGKESVELKCSMPGIFSAYNALCTVAIAMEITDDTDDIVKGLCAARVKGRNEVIPVPADYDVIIDYAHNGQSFNSVIDTFSAYDHNRIITVFGSVGDRAQLRREELGLASGKSADLSVITTDDPAYEDPMKICEEIAAFVRKAGGKYVIEPDRKKAVYYALSQAESGDIVLLLGKGHETVMKVAGEKIHYSDHESVESFFEEADR